MDVVRLDSNFQPDVLIEGWSSMIWTERPSSLGEFSMTTPLVDDSRALIPEGSYISLLDSEEIMLVKTHNIDKDANGGVVNQISGVSFPEIIGDRDTVGHGVNTELFPSNWETRKYYSPAFAVAALIWNHLVNNTSMFTGPVEDLNGDPIYTVGDSRLLIPNLGVTLSNIQPWTDPDPDTSGEFEGPPGTRKWALERGSLDRPVFDILAIGKLGIRSKRPTNKVGQLVYGSFSGTMNEASPDVITHPVINIFQGRDLRSSVTFRYDAGQIEEPKYLYSIQGYKNIVHVASGQKELIVAAPGVDPNISGVNRRVLYFDAGDLSDLDIEGNFTDADWDRILKQKALTELKNYNKISLFDGEISPLSSIKYGIDYGLGDQVTLQAEYGLKVDMIVSEYIRSQNEDGEVGYPTLTFVD